MNHKSIQILRTSLSNNDDKIKDETLLDGQPLYNKKTKQFYIGEKDSSGNELTLKELKPVNANL